jgi:hypothetical protein
MSENHNARIWDAGSKSLELDSANLTFSRGEMMTMLRLGTRAGLNLLIHRLKPCFILQRHLRCCKFLTGDVKADTAREAAPDDNRENFC